MVLSCGTTKLYIIIIGEMYNFLVKYKIVIKVTDTILCSTEIFKPEYL